MTSKGGGNAHTTTQKGPLGVWGGGRRENDSHKGGAKTIKTVGPCGFWLSLLTGRRKISWGEIHLAVTFPLPETFGGTEQRFVINKLTVGKDRFPVVNPLFMQTAKTF